ncbi:Dihydroxyacetone kinase 2 [Tulasnella sp. 424]|nr:Dihydroxyacetone kinase 2 [Tulasnella sp. 424]
MRLVLSNEEQEPAQMDPVITLRTPAFAAAGPADHGTAMLPFLFPHPPADIKAQCRCIPQGALSPQSARTCGREIQRLDCQPLRWYAANLIVNDPLIVLYKRNPPQDQVSLISGGGSGHEPAHAGFVGDGMLSAAVCGNIFASPNAVQIRKAIELVGNPKGTLIVVKNYTGDALNFGLASEQYKAAGGTGDVRVLIVGDDVAVGRTQGGIVGRRGLAGTILVYKIAAALSRSGASLDEVEATAKQVAENTGTIGVPGTEEAESHLGGDEIELGMGIHNEPGNQRLKPLPKLSKLIDQMLAMLTSTTDKERSFVPFQNDGNDEVVLLVNNLGAISELEMGAIAGEAVSWLKNHNFKTRRVLVGTYMTSLNMPGFSLTLLLLPRPNSNDGSSGAKLLELLDEPTEAPGWKWHSRSELAFADEASASKESETKLNTESSESLRAEDPKAFVEAIKRAANEVITAEPEITRQDQIAGDGDAGLTLKAGAEGVLKAISDGRLTGDNVISSVMTLAQVADERMGGTSGALYSIFLSALAKGLKDAASSSSTADLGVWAKTAAAALTTLQKYPLTAFVEALPNGLLGAVDAAKKAADETKKLSAKAGRAAYVNQEDLAKANVPDPGAFGVAVIVAGLAGVESPKA